MPRPIPRIAGFFFLCWSVNAQIQAPEFTPFSAAPAALVEAVRDLPERRGRAGTGLLRTIRYSIGEDRRVTRREHLIYRIDRADPRAGLDRIQAPFRSWHQRRPEVRGRVVTADGSVHRLDSSTLTEVSPPSPDPSITHDLKVLTGPLPGALPGAVVEVESLIADAEPLFEAGSAHRDFLSSQIEFASLRIAIETAPGLPLNVAVSGAEQATRSEHAKRGKRVVEIEVAPAPMIEPRSMLGVLSGASLDLPHVSFGLAESWNSVARGYADLIPREQDATPGDWPEAGASVKETADRLLTALHRRVRYAGVELGNASIVPRTPAETLTRGYGDCKDKSLLLIALLRDRGVDARLALLAAGAQPDVDMATPGFGLFNHAIVYIPGEPALWIDPAVAIARAGQLPAQDQGRAALIVDADTTSLIRTPQSTPQDNFSRLEVEQALLPDGAWRFVKIQSGTGRFEMALRQSRGGRTAEQSLEDEKRRLADREEDAPAALETIALDYPPPDDLTQPFAVESVLEWGNQVNDIVPTRLVTMAQTRQLFSGLPLSVGFGANEAEGPLRFPEPFRAEQVYRYVPPPGYRIVGLPKERSVTLGPAQLEERYEEREDGVVEAAAWFDLVKAEYTAEEADAFRKALGEERKRKETQLSFQSVVEGHIGAGRYPAALREAGRLAEAHPQSAHLRYGLVSALLSVGAGVSARAEAEKLAAEMPEDPIALAAVGRAYAHDLMGRLHAPGFDRARAIDAYRKSLERDPDRRRALEDLVALLERDDEAVQYGKRASLDEAYELLSSIESARGRRGHRDRLARYLAYRGQYAEALEMDGLSDGLSIALQVAADGVSGAEHRISAMDGRSRAGNLAAAANWLARWRHYAEAAVLMERAAGSEGGSSSFARWATTYRNKHRYEDISAPEDDPIGVAQAWIQAQFLADDWRAAVEPLVTRRCGKVELRLPAAERRLRSRFEQLTRTIDRDKRLDAYMFRYEWRVEGDARTGYHVSARSKTSSYPLNYFVVEEDGVLRLLDTTDGSGRYMSDLGCYVTFLLDAGRQDEAFGLLDHTARIDRVAFAESQAFWCKNCDRNETNARLAAAVLVARDGERALPLLDMARKAYEEETAADRRLALHRTLLRMYEAVGQREEAIPLAFAMFEAHPDHARAIDQAAELLDRAGRAREAAAKMETIAMERPDDETLVRELISLQGRARDREGGERALAMLADRARATDFNNRAWVGAVIGRPEQSDLLAAQRAVDEGLRSRSYVNTLAVLEALAGHAEAARQLLVEATKPTVYVIASAGDWLAAGLIVEALGLERDARAHLETAAKLDPSEDSNSVGAIARARLAILAP